VLLALEAVQTGDGSGACGAVMDFLAVLSVAVVRRSLVHAAGREGLRGQDEPLAGLGAEVVDAALARLAGASLLTFSLGGSAVTAHRLVIRVIRESLEASDSLLAVCTKAAQLLDTLARSMTEAWRQDRPAALDLVEKITALAESAAACPQDDDLDRCIMRLRGWALFFLNSLGADTTQSIAIGERLLADYERIAGPEDPDTLSWRNNLAIDYRDVGRTAEAITLHEQNLAIRERILVPDHPDTLASRHNLANAYRAADRLDEAITLDEQTLADYERVLGPEDPDTLSRRNNLANAYRDVGRTAEAITLHEQNLAIRERILGPDHPDTLASRHNLANACEAAGRLDEAEILRKAEPRS
jgi:tetratricopeptide (TPR) repeat protein